MLSPPDLRRGPIADWGGFESIWVSMTHFRGSCSRLGLASLRGVFNRTSFSTLDAEGHHEIGSQIDFDDDMAKRPSDLPKRRPVAATTLDVERGVDGVAPLFKYQSHDSFRLGY